MPGQECALSTVPSDEQFASNPADLCIPWAPFCVQILESAKAEIESSKVRADINNFAVLFYHRLSPGPAFGTLESPCNSIFALWAVWRSAH
ncbi:MAG: hypothetical protein WCS93_06940 [Candidatus Delongbacteria bacterium]